MASCLLGFPRLCLVMLDAARHAAIGVCVPSSFGALGGIWNSTESVPDHCPFTSVLFKISFQLPCKCTCTKQ